METKKQYNTIDYYAIKEKRICSNVAMDNLKEDILTRLEKEYPEALKAPSSTSGKYHPYVEQQPYGLLLHSLATVMVLNDLARLGMYEGLDYEAELKLWDLLKFAAFFHDIGKIVNPTDYKNHAENGAVWLAENYTDTLMALGYSAEDIEVCITKPIKNHMRFNENQKLDMPSHAVEMADYIVSRYYVNSFKSITYNFS